MNLITRKRMLAVSLMGVALFGVFIPTNVSYFVYDTFGSSFVQVLEYLTLIAMIGVATLLPSVIMFFVTEDTFEVQKKILSIYLPIYLLAIIITPRYIGDGFLNITKGKVAILVSGVYVLVSLLSITYQFFKKDTR